LAHGFKGFSPSLASSDARPVTRHERTQGSCSTHKSQEAKRRQKGPGQDTTPKDMPPTRPTSSNQAHLPQFQYCEVPVFHSDCDSISGLNKYPVD
jgi:hypothetical protein